MIFHLARGASRGDEDNALTATQWAALRFFAGASRLSRTPSGFAHFNATTRGTASQTVKSLERLGYLQRARAPRDGRSVIFELTEAGCECLSRDPLLSLEAALGQLPDDDVRRLCDVLQSSMKGVADRQGASVLGTCRDCRNLEAGESLPVCACTGELLESADFSRLCMHFASRAKENGPDAGIAEQ
jgi:DNA-binding MarR family transcriptional regulator